MRDRIEIPPKAQARLAELITAGQSIQREIDAIVSTLREAKDVPAHYQLRDITIGFEAPAGEALAGDALPSIPE